MNKPASWADAARLAGQPDLLEQLLQVRLVELAFTTDSAVSIRAIEMLRAGAGFAVDDIFQDVPVTEIAALRERVRTRLIVSLRESAADAALTPTESD